MADRHLSWLHFLTVRNGAKKHGYASVSGEDLPSFAFVPRSHAAGSCGSSVCSFLRNHTLISMVAAPGHLPPAAKWLPFSPRPHQHAVTCFLADRHSNWDDTQSQASFNLHFPVTKDADYFFKNLLAICFLPFKNLNSFYEGGCLTV